MSEISVIGLGAMGSAITSALLEAGRSVTVWNRTQAKAAPLQAQGADVAPAAVDALRASPATIVCVDNYDISSAILADVGDAVAGKILIQLTSDTGTAAAELATWSAANDARYLDGVILAYPSDMGGADAAVLVAGDADAWAGVEPLMRDVAGASTYVGDNVRVPSMLSAAAIAPLLGAVIGAVQGAAMCEAEGFPVADFAAMMSPLSDLLAGQMQHALATIAENRFDAPEAALKTYASSVTDRTAESRARDVNVEFYGFVDDLLTRAIEHGLGDQEISAVIKLWR